MCDALYRIFDRMRKVIHRIYAPLVTCVVMGCMSYSVYNGISHIDVRRCHVYFCSKHLFAVCIFARFHLFKELQILLYASVSVRAFLARLFEGASVFSYLICVEVAYKRLALVYELYCAFVHFIEIVRCPQAFVPFKAQPSYICFD